MPATARPDRAAALQAVLNLARTERAQFGERQQLSAEMVDLLRRAGIYRALVAKRFGGNEQSPSDFMRTIEKISAVDGSTGWVASFGFSAVYLSSLPLASLEAMYADGPDIVYAGGIYPPQPARAVEGGYEVSGRWSWGSGSTGADYIGCGITTEGAAPGKPSLPLIAVTPARNVSIVRNWDVNGMKGTGSHDMVMDRVVVPAEWTFVRGSASTLETPLYRYPSMALAAQVLAVVALGVARGALDEIIAIAGGRTSITGAPVLADRAYVQIEVARAEAALRSARAFFYEITDEVYAMLVAGDDIPTEKSALIRLASSNAARVSTDVTTAVYRMSGTTGIFTAHPIARHFQDALIPQQHAFLSEGTWQNAGRVLLGLPATPGFP